MKTPTQSEGASLVLLVESAQVHPVSRRHSIRTRFCTGTAEIGKTNSQIHCNFHLSFISEALRSSGFRFVQSVLSFCNVPFISNFLSLSSSNPGFVRANILYNYTVPLSIRRLIKISPDCFLKQLLPAFYTSRSFFCSFDSLIFPCFLPLRRGFWTGTPFSTVPSLFQPPFLGPCMHDHCLGRAT
jgi:hypothetical protein